MKTQRLFTLLAVALVIIMAGSCGRGSDTPAVRASSDHSAIRKEVKLNDELSEKLGSWLKKDAECYGIVVGYFADGSTMGKSVKCRVVAIRPDKIKMKTIESVSLLPGEGCDKMGLAYGDTWWEEEGDIFLTREEADAYIKTKGWYAE